MNKTAVKNTVDARSEKFERDIAKAKIRLTKLEVAYAEYKDKVSYVCDSDGYCRFDFKRKKKDTAFYRSCGKRFPKSQFKFVIFEDYDIVQTYSDAGYGDDDCFAWGHEFTLYRICPNCRTMELVETVITEKSNEWSRSGRDMKNTYKQELVPDGWGGERVVFLGNEAVCRRKLNAIKRNV